MKNVYITIFLSLGCGLAVGFIAILAAASLWIAEKRQECVLWGIPQEICESIIAIDAF